MKHDRLLFRKFSENLNSLKIFSIIRINISRLERVCLPIFQSILIIVVLRPESCLIYFRHSFGCFSQNFLSYVSPFFKFDPDTIGNLCKLKLWRRSHFTVIDKYRLCFGYTICSGTRERIGCWRDNRRIHKS